MKISNLLIEKLFAKEIAEIRKIYKSSILREIDIKQTLMIGTDDIGKIMKLKDEVKDLLKLSYQVDSSNILDINLDGLSAERWEGFASDKARKIIDGYTPSSVGTINSSQNVSVITSPIESEEEDHVGRICDMFINFKNRIEKLETGKVDKVSGEEARKEIIAGLKRMGINISQ